MWSDCFVVENGDVLPNSVKIPKHQFNTDPFFWLFSCSIRSAGWTALFIWVVSLLLEVDHQLMRGWLYWNSACIWKGNAWWLGYVVYPPAESSQVKSNSQRHCRQYLEYLLWLHIGMHTHWQSQVKSHESCQVKSRGAACLIFVSWTPVISMTAAILHW